MLSGQKELSIPTMLYMLLMGTIYTVSQHEKTLLSQRWPRDAPIYKLYHPKFCSAYGHCTLRGFWFWTNLSSGNFVYFWKSDVSAVQGHPRSLILVPIESAYATSYQSVIVTSVLSCTISEISFYVLLAVAPPLFYRNFGGVPFAPDRPCWGQPAHKP